jgi:hypothetical protein
MKITLEHQLTRLIACPQSLNCLICRSSFTSSKLRALLYSDRGLVIGDVCPECLKLTAPEIKRSLRMQANQLMAEPKSRGAQTISSHQQALELLEIATEEVKFPPIYQRFLKHLERFVQDSRALEEARFKLSDRGLTQRSQLERIFRENIHPEKGNDL